MRAFLSRDPAADDSLGDLYAAFENNPGSYTNPMGLAPRSTRQKIINFFKEIAGFGKPILEIPKKVAKTPEKVAEVIHSVSSPEAFDIVIGSTRVFAEPVHMVKDASKSFC